MERHKRRGIVAVPGEYKYGDLVEVKTAEELREAAFRQPIIMLTTGHPVDGMPSAKDVIGTVRQNWNEDKQRVDGEFWFNDDRLPDHIREKVVNLQPLSISPGFMIDGIGENGEQEGMVYTHLAVLDDEDPRCPLGECGVNIRMDSKEGHILVRFDQKSDLEPPEEPAKEEATETVEAEPEPTKTEEAEPEISDSDEDEAIPSSEPVLENQEVAEEEQPREPEVVIPPSVTATDSGEFKEVDGWITYTPKVYRDKEDE